MIRYFPATGFEREEERFKWGMSRSAVRSRLELPFTPEDAGPRLKDIYMQEDTVPARWMLHYDSGSRFSALEIYEGVDIIIEHIVLLFNKSMDWLIPELETLSPYKVIMPGKYFFPALNMIIANKTACGSAGDELAYFYGAANQDLF